MITLNNQQSLSLTALSIDHSLLKAQEESKEPKDLQNAVEDPHLATDTSIIAGSMVEEIIGLTQLHLLEREVLKDLPKYSTQELIKMLEPGIGFGLKQEIDKFEDDDLGLEEPVLPETDNWTRFIMVTKKDDFENNFLINNIKLQESQYSCKTPGSLSPSKLSVKTTTTAQKEPFGFMKSSYRGLTLIQSTDSKLNGESSPSVQAYLNDNMAKLLSEKAKKFITQIDSQDEPSPVPLKKEVLSKEEERAQIFKEQYFMRQQQAKQERKRKQIIAEAKAALSNKDWTKMTYDYEGNVIDTQPPSVNSPPPVFEKTIK